MGNARAHTHTHTHTHTRTNIRILSNKTRTYKLTLCHPYTGQDKAFSPSKSVVLRQFARLLYHHIITFGQLHIDPHHPMWEPKTTTTSTTLCMQCGRMTLPCDPNSVRALVNTCMTVSTCTVSRLSHVQGVFHRYGLGTVSNSGQRDSCEGNWIFYWNPLTEITY
jgi:hypothetical protein